MVCLRHSLIDGFNAVAHGELVDDLLRRRIEIRLPGILLQNKRVLCSAYSINDIVEIQVENKMQRRWQGKFLCKRLYLHR